MRRVRLCVLIATALAACGDNNHGPKVSPDSILVIVDAAPDGADQPDAVIDAVPADAGPPATLADTGLCADAGCTQIAAGIWTYGSHDR